MGKVIGSNPILGTIYNPRFTTRISHFILIFLLFRLVAQKGRFLRIFAVFCSFFGNILAMTRGFCSLFWGNTNIFSPVQFIVLGKIKF